MKDWHKHKPELFNKRPYYLPGCDNLFLFPVNAYETDTVQRHDQILEFYMVAKLTNFNVAAQI